MSFNEFKAVIELYTGLERDALHIHGALLLYLLAMWVFGHNRRSRFPWLFVLGIELANETYDLIYQVNGGEPPRWNDSLQDLWNTMLWPTVLLFVGRYTNMFQHRSRRATAQGGTAAPDTGARPSIPAA